MHALEYKKYKKEQTMYPVHLLQFRKNLTYNSQYCRKFEKFLRDADCLMHGSHHSQEGSCVESSLLHLQSQCLFVAEME